MAIGVGSLKAILGEIGKAALIQMETVLLTHGMRIINGEHSTLGRKKMELIGGLKMVLNGLILMVMVMVTIRPRELLYLTSSLQFLQPQSTQIMMVIQIIGLL